MKNRKVKRIINSQDVMMGDIKIGQPLPMQGIDQIDPFLLLHHGGPKTSKPGENALDVGPHPHRGFEPVTFIFSGDIHHKDSRGHDNIVKSGGVQWMTAGMGIIHSESPSQKFIEEGGEFEMIQLWINLPKELKMIQPRYQGVQRSEIPYFESDDKLTRINVVAGKYQEITGSVDNITDVRAMTMELKKGAKATVDCPANRNAILYVLHGDTHVNEVIADTKQLVWFENEGETINIEAREDSLMLYLDGNTIDEPVEQYGPFVMNTQTEIMEAMRDYQMGKMGFLAPA